MSVKNKKQTPIRLYPDQIEKIKAKTVQDGITFQKLAEVLFTAYLKGNKEINRLVEQFADDKKNKKKRYSFNEMEADELYRILEEEYSPLKYIEDARREIEDDQD